MRETTSIKPIFGKINARGSVKVKLNRTAGRIAKQHCNNLPIKYVMYLLLTSIVYHTYTYLSILF
nr:MAG TPA: hypothetical protein [Inoviridae sp.]